MATQQRRFSAHLLDGRVVRCVSIEQDDTHGLWVWTTAGERIPAARILRLEHQAPTDTPTGEAVDAFLDLLPRSTIPLVGASQRAARPLRLIR